MLRLACLFVPLPVFLASPAPPTDIAPEPRPVLRVERNITYATVDGEKLQLDFAVPKGGGPYPAVVLFHGGAWRYGHRRDISGPGTDKDGKPTPSIMEKIAARGYAVASVSYRLAPKYKFPAQIEDAKTAIRFLRAHAKQFDIDPERVAAGGFSAGAHLSLLLGLADKSAGLEGTLYPEQDSRVQAVVSYFGPTDLSLYAASPGLVDGYMVPFLGAECKIDPAIYKRASPSEYVTKDDPPVLIFHGTIDVIVPIIHSEQLLKKLRDTGVPADLVIVRGEGHGWGGATLEKTQADALRFLDTHLKGKK